MFAVGFAEDEGEQNRKQDAELEKHGGTHLLMAAAGIDMDEAMNDVAQPDVGRATQRDDEDETRVGHAAPHHGKPAMS